MIDPALLATRAPAAADADLHPVFRLRHAPPQAHGRMGGIPVTVDVWCAFGLALATWTCAGAVLPHEAPGRGAVAYTVAGSLTALLLLGALGLRVIGQCFTARRAGLPVARIALSLVGGALELGAEPRSPGVACRLALAGSLTGFATAFVAMLAHVVLVEIAADPLIAAVPAVVAAGILAVSLLNLLPGLPLDGGRWLHAGFWWVTGDRAQALRVARVAGRVLGMALLALAIFASATGDVASAFWSALLGFTISFGGGLDSPLRRSLFLYQGGATAAPP